MSEGSGQHERKIVVRNVACADLRTASDKSLAKIGRIENVATLLYSPQNAESVLRTALQNVATMLETPPDAQIVVGQETFEKRNFETLSEPISVIVVGQLVLATDIDAEALRTGVDKLFVIGQVVYPDHLGGIVQSKLDHITGQAIAYAAGAKLTMGQLNLTQRYLEALEDNSVLTVIGALSARAILPNELIERKVRELQLVGGLTCREENAGVLLNRLSGSTSSVHTTVIPEGFEPAKGTVMLDAALLGALPSRRLYCRELRIADDVDADELDTELDAVMVANLLVAPARLRTVLARKCNLLDTEAILYNGTLWQFDDEHTLHPQRFDFVDGKVTLVVTGELTIAPEVQPALLAERVEKVHNFGEIFCTPTQMSVLENLAGAGRGEFIDNGDETDSDTAIGNTAYLKL